MAIDPRYSDLMQADIDGEIGAEEKAELEAFLATSEQAKRLQAELKEVAESLDSITELEPPPHLRHVILNMVPAKPPARKGRGLRQRIFSMPAIGYVGTFALGAILALALVDSGRSSDRAFDDVSGLVGTIADLENIGPPHGSVTVNESEVAGTVTLRSRGPILILDFDLFSRQAVEIVARYPGDAIWFNGFAQLESTGASVAVETGMVKLEMAGKRRYAVFLKNHDRRPARIGLEFLADGEVIHETKLDFGA